MRHKSFSRVLAAVAGATLILALAWLVLAVQTTRAATIDVPAGGSIQTAINGAAPGDTIRVAQGTFTEKLVITKSLTLLGGFTDFGAGTRIPRTTVISPSSRGIEINGTGITVIVDGFEIKNASDAGNGGAIQVMVEDGSRVVIHDNYIHNSRSTGGDGGGIYAYMDNRCVLEITNNTVMSNSASSDGGGIYAYLWMSGTLTLDGNEIVSNTAGNEGGFYAEVDSFGRFSVDGNTVLSNTATGFNGGFYFDAYYDSHGTFDGNDVFGNRATSGSYGGGYVYIGYNSSSTFADNEFRRNTAGNDCGGLYLDVEYHSAVSGGNLTVADNQAGGLYGGGYVYAYANSSVALPGSDVTGNQAGSYGGVYFEAYDHATITVPDLYVYDNRALIWGVGGVYLDADDGNDVIIATNARVISNTASGDGGGAGVYVEDGGLVDLTGGRFERNAAGGGGGGLYVDDIYGGATLWLSDTQFLTNTANTDGGGIYFDSGPNYGSYLNLSHATFVSNTARTGSGGGFYVDDGPFYNVMSEVSLQADHMTFLRNRADLYGGGFYLYEAYNGSGQMIFDDGVYRDNWAGQYGGAVDIDYCSDGCYVSMSRNLFEGNEATDYDGGAVCFYEAYEGSEAHFDDNKFYNNVAGGDGGAFYSDYFAEDGAIGTFDRNELIGNVAGDEGGAVYINDFAYDGGVASFNDNIVKDNRSDGDGAGVYLEYPAYSGSRAEFRDNVIVGNVISSTSDHDGGGLYFYELDEGSILWMTGNVITGNVATGDGGGLFWGEYIDYGSTLYFEDNELQRNRAGGDGGGCYFHDYIDDGANFYFNRNLVNHNTALGSGGGCYFAEGFVEANIVDFIGNQFNDNTAGGNYGALYFYDLDDGTFMRFWDNQVIGNRAGISGTQVTGGDGGGVTFYDIEYGSEADLRNNRIISNTAYMTGTTGGRYGGLYAYLGTDSGLLTLRNNVIAGNAVQDAFAGLYVEMDDGSRLVAERNLIAANTAVTESGGVYIYGEADSQYFLRRNRILDNVAGARGGLWIENGDATDPLWGLSENNLIAGNVGSGIYLVDADLHSTNDTIADNGDYGIMMDGTVTSTAWLSNTIVWNHTWSFTTTNAAIFTMTATTSDIQGGWAGAGNINANPLFVNAAANDYHLQAASPAVDKVAAATAPPIDLDGVPRPVPAGGLADMGCYEWRLAGVEIGPDLSTTPKPGTQAVFVHTITNTGNAQDVFNLSAVSANGWTVQVVPAQVTLPAGGTASVTVTVNVPAGLPAGTADTINVSAASVPNPAVVDGAQDGITVALAPALAFTPNRAAGGLAGMLVVYEHTLTNLGNGADTFQLSAVSSQGWSVSIAPHGVTLAAGASTTVRVWVTVPAGTPAGTVDVTTVTATSLGDGTVSASVTDTTTAQGWPYTVYLPLIVRRGP